DLDLRLSASEARFGRMRLGDLAASVQIRPGRIEANLGSAAYHDGVLRGKLSLIARGDDTEIRGVGSFDDVDVGGFLAATGQGRWIQGPGRGQFDVAGAGRSPAAIANALTGQAQVDLKEGEIIGVALADAIRRVEKRPLAGSLNWKGGRTPFAEATMQIE